MSDYMADTTEPTLEDYEQVYINSHLGARVAAEQEIQLAREVARDQDQVTPWVTIDDLLEVKIAIEKRDIFHSSARLNALRCYCRLRVLQFARRIVNRYESFIHPPVKVAFAPAVTQEPRETPSITLDDLLEAEESLR